MKKHFKYLIIAGISLLVLMLAYIAWHQAKAGLVSSFSDQMSTQAIATASNHTITFTTSSDFGPGKTLEIYFENGFDLSQIDYTDIDLLDDGSDKNLGLSPGSGVASSIGVAISGQTIIFTQNDTDTIDAGSFVTITIGTNSSYQTVGDKQIYNPSAPNTYSISLSGSFGDMGTISIQIVTTDTVSFHGTIESNLSFAMRNSDDTGDFIGCNFGNGSYSAVSECQLRLAADTNMEGGFQVLIEADGNLRSDNGYITNIISGNSVTAGTEGYGLALTPAFGINAGSSFAANDSPIPSTSTLLLHCNSVYNYIQGNLSTSSLIDLRLGMSALSKPGIYHQAITYSVVSNF